MNSKKPMATPLLRSLPGTELRPVRQASRLLRSFSPAEQARREAPRVFCDPRMPGGWRALEDLADTHRAA